MRRRIAVGLVVLMVLLAACGDDVQPSRDRDRVSHTTAAPADPGAVA